MCFVPPQRCIAPCSHLFLHRIATTETWNDVMEACMLTRDCADSDTGFEQCGTTWAILYFVSFMLIGSFIALNLFVTVLLDQFQQEDELNSEESQYAHTHPPIHLHPS